MKKVSQSQILQTQNNPFRNSALIGLTVIFISGWMLIVGRTLGTQAELPEGFSSIILALEFGKSNYEIDKVIGSLTLVEITTLKQLVWLDMLFLVSYTAFIYSFMSKIANIISVPKYETYARLAILVGLADVCENTLLLMALDGNEIPVMLLQLSTWIKWLLLAFLLLMIGRFLVTTGRVYDKMAGIACYAPLVVGILAFFYRGQMNEVFASLFFLLFPLLISYSWFTGLKKNLSAT